MLPESLTSAPIADAPLKVQALFQHCEAAQPRALRGLTEARAVNAPRFDQITAQLLEWGEGALGERFIERALGAFVRFSEGVILSQARYERAGHYENRSYAEVNAELYSQRGEMDDYLWGVYLTNTLWAHHMDLSLFYLDRFLGRLPERLLSGESGDPLLIELAPGHGGWGLLALQAIPQLRLEGYDISPSSTYIAGALSKAAGLTERAQYHERDALTMSETPAAVADICVCNFLVEHLETPARLLQSIAHVLRPGGRAFFSGALTAAQIDHIYEFRQESELLALAEGAGLRCLESRSAAPARLLPRARFLPRSMSLILEKPAR